MNEKEFCYWLQGLFELTNIDKINMAQTVIIKDHLKLVFDKKTPERSPPPLPSTDIVQFPYSQNPNHFIYTGNFPHLDPLTATTC